MSQITKEDALDRAKQHISTLIQFEITDQWNTGWRVYGADKLANCWYITLSPSLIGSSTGATYMLAISKENGSVLHSGPVGE
jgi:hypothetical protein